MGDGRGDGQVIDYDIISELEKSLGRPPYLPASSTILALCPLIRPVVHASHITTDESNLNVRRVHSLHLHLRHRTLSRHSSDDHDPH